MEKELRRLQNLLIVTGNGLILFGLWSVLKLILYVVSSYGQLLEEYNKNATDMFSFSLFFTIIMILIIIISLIIFLFHYYIGRCARSDALGIKDRKLYIILSVIFIILMIVITALNFYSLFTAGSVTISHIVGFIVDLTMVILLFELISSAIKVKKLRKQLKQERGIACS